MSFVRESASFVLRRIAAKALIPVLIKLLDSPDRKVQYNATMGLYEAAEGWHNTLVQGYARAWRVFLEAPEQYINQWKLWWQEGAKIEVPPGVPATRVEVSTE